MIGIAASRGTGTAGRYRRTKSKSKNDSSTKESVSDVLGAVRANAGDLDFSEGRRAGVCQRHRCGSSRERRDPQKSRGLTAAETASSLKLLKIQRCND